MKRGLRKYKTANYINTEKEVTYYLQSVLKEDDLNFFFHSVKILAETKGMTPLAHKIGMSKKAFIEALLNDNAAPSLPVLLKLIHHLGFSISIDKMQYEKEIKNKNFEPALIIRPNAELENIEIAC